MTLAQALRRCRFSGYRSRQSRKTPSANALEFALCQALNGSRYCVLSVCRCNCLTWNQSSLSNRSWLVTLKNSMVWRSLFRRSFAHPAARCSATCVERSLGPSSGLLRSPRCLCTHDWSGCDESIRRSSPRTDSLGWICRAGRLLCVAGGGDGLPSMRGLPALSGCMLSVSGGLRRRSLLSPHLPRHRSDGSVQEFRHGCLEAQLGADVELLDLGVQKLFHPLVRSRVSLGWQLHISIQQ